MVKPKEMIELIKLLRIDVYMALFMFGYGVYQVPNVELTQSKICLNELGQDESLCDNLSSGETSTAEIQSQVLIGATSIHNYQTLVATIPGVIQSFFFGYWIDKYPSHIRSLLILPCVGVLIQSLIMIYQCIYFDVAVIYSLWAYLSLGLGGGQSLVLAASFTYAAKKTPQKFRSVRFAIVDLFIFTAYPIAVMFGGKILAAQTWFGPGKRNFTGVFATSAITMIIAIIWAIYFIDDSVSKSDKTIAVPTSSSATGETSMTEIDLADGENKADNVQSNDKIGAWAIAADIFDFNNVKTTMKTFLRDRPDNGRKKVTLLASSVLLVFISLISESMFGFQYTEKAFLWDYQKYSNTYGYIQLIQSFGTISGSMLFKNTFKLDDAEVAAIGILSHLIGNLIKGIPTVECYIIGSLAFCLSGIAIPATRSCLTRIIDFNEIGQILAMISCMQALGPLFASMQTTAIFKATIDTAPGTTYHFLAVSVIVPLIIHLWVSLTNNSLEEDANKSTKVRFEIGDGKESVNIQGLSETQAEDKL